MDFLFSPWRFSYVTSVKEGNDGCVFCRLASSEATQDESSYVIHRAVHHFVVLNAFPYTSGHLMIVPYDHAARLSDLQRPGLEELMRLAAQSERVLDEAYHPGGINIGLNLGECAGAGIAGHLHMHAVPRWTGDTNFMTVTGETRVLPEDLHDTWLRLHGRFQREDGGES